MSTSKLKVETDVPNEVAMTRVFDAPRRLVMKAMMTPELIKQWLGGKRAEVPTAEFDARVGGRYKFVFKQPNGSGFQFSGVVQELSEDRVVYTQQFNDDPGTALVTTTFAEAGGKTTMRVVVRFESQALRDMVLQTGMTEGAGETYDYLEALVKTL
jgi:uncharacterized protein YndB with AHSA1/START domain